MARFEVLLKDSVKKDLRNVPAHHAARILAKLASLKDDPRPHGCEKLSGQERYRVRQGDYRIIYEVADKVLLVFVVKVGHRRDVYR